MTKRIAIGLVLFLSVFAMTSGLVFAAAQKVELVACPINYPSGTTPPPGGGFVIFNNPRSAGHNLEVTVSLKGVTPNTEYDIYLFVDQGLEGDKIGTVKTNPRGNATLHIDGLLEEGTHVLAVDVTLKGSGADVYETSGIHDNPMEGPSMTFK